MESLLRGRDEQVTNLKDQLQEYKAQLSEQDQTLRDNEQQLREQTREANRWQQSAEAARSGADAGESLGFDIAGNDTSDSNELIAELSQEISRLKTQIEQAPKQAASAGSVGDEVLLFLRKSKANYIWMAVQHSQGVFRLISTDGTWRLVSMNSDHVVSPDSEISSQDYQDQAIESLENYINENKQ